MDIVLVNWVDSKMSEKSWHSEDDAKCWDISNCQSVGFLLADNDTKIVLAQCWGDANVNGVLAIPKVSIKSIKKLE